MTATGGRGDRVTATRADLVVGTELPTLTVRLTRTSLVRYAGASLDFNPIHFSDHAATAIGLPGVVAHGMLSMGIALRLVTEWVGHPDRIVATAVRFSAPVVVPDDGEGVTMIITGVISSVDGPQATVKLEATCGGVRVLSGAVVDVDLDR